MRVLDSNDSLAHESSYAGQMMALNRKKLSKTMYGMQDMSNLVYLQVKGKNQLYKEIEETQSMPSKFIDRLALHRNELTEEYEPNVPEQYINQ